MAKKEEKTRTLTESPIPVTILWDKILMLPIVGTMDSRRAQEIMDAMLAKVLDTESQVVILDILGVATLDSAVANHLMKITKATKLMGCDCIISGISPVIAQTLVHLGVEVGEVVTTATVRGALELAFDRIGFEVRRKK